MINTKGKLLSICLLWALVFIAAVVLPQRQTRVWAADETETITTAKFKNALTGSFTLDMSNTKAIDIAGIDMKQSDSANLLKKLLGSCTQLKSLHLNNCDLSEFDLNVLQSASGLTSLWLDKCKISDISFIKNTGGGEVNLAVISGQQTYR